MPSDALFFTYLSDVALLGDPSKLPLHPSVIGFVVGAAQLRCRLDEQPKPRVKRVRTQPQALQNLPNRIPTHPDLLYRITPELVAIVARPHLGLLASKLGAKLLQISGHLRQKRQILSIRSVLEMISRSHVNPPFPGASKVGKPRAEIDKAAQADLHEAG